LSACSWTYQNVHEQSKNDAKMFMNTSTWSWTDIHIHELECSWIFVHEHFCQDDEQLKDVHEYSWTVHENSWIDEHAFAGVLILCTIYQAVSACLI
jgi:hypothetical protein